MEIFLNGALESEKDSMTLDSLIERVTSHLRYAAWDIYTETARHCDSFRASLLSWATLAAFVVSVIIFHHFRSHWFFVVVLHSNLSDSLHECCLLLPLLSYPSTVLAFMDWIAMNMGGKQFVTMHLKRIMGYLTFARVYVCVRMCACKCVYAQPRVDQKVSWCFSGFCWTL